MLKRQRPASPPLSTPTVPLVDNPPFEMMGQHHSKRRRVLPPVLDGQVRGWGVTKDEDDDEDEEYQEDEVNTTDLEGRLADTNGYKSANGVLHELHTLHRRRHFSPSSPDPQPSWPIRPSSQAHDKNAALHLSGLSIAPEYVTPTDELLRVMERYEHNNRLLGSLFLSRRRRPESSDGDTTAS